MALGFLCVPNLIIQASKSLNVILKVKVQGNFLSKWPLNTQNQTWISFLAYLEADT